MPSLASPLANTAAKAPFSASMPSSRSPAPETRLICASASGAWPASLRAHCKRRVEQLVILDQAVDEPELERFFGEDRVADEVHLKALFVPTRRGRRCVPPKPGMMPSLISGWPKIAERAAMRTSQAIASSQPPPKARPLTAAIVAMPSEPSSRNSACAPFDELSAARLVHRA